MTQKRSPSTASNGHRHPSNVRQSLLLARSQTPIPRVPPTSNHSPTLASAITESPRQSSEATASRIRGSHNLANISKDLCDKQHVYISDLDKAAFFWPRNVCVSERMCAFVQAWMQPCAYCVRYCAYFCVFVSLQD